MTDNRTTELQATLDEFEHECFMLRVEASETRARDDVVRKSYKCIRDGFAERIAATLGSEKERALEKLVQDVWAAYSTKAESSFHPAWEVDSELARRMAEFGFKEVC